MKIISPYIVNLAPTLSGHWYDVWRKKPGVLKDDGSNKIFYDDDGLKTVADFLGTFPSSTTILVSYPQSPYLTRWIAEQGWSESQRIKSEAGEAGTRIHEAIQKLLEGQELMRTLFTLEEWWKINTFVAWYRECNPEVIALEVPIFSEKSGYAGRADLVAMVAGQLGVIDYKSSGSIYKHFPLQFASYAKSIEEMTGLVIEFTAALQMGAKNKNGYRYEIYPEWREHFDVFRNVQGTWTYDNKKKGESSVESPALRLPDVLKL